MITAFAGSCKFENEHHPPFGRIRGLALRANWHTYTVPDCATKLRDVANRR